MGTRGSWLTVRNLIGVERKNSNTQMGRRGGKQRPTDPEKIKGMVNLRIRKWGKSGQGDSSKGCPGRDVQQLDHLGGGGTAGGRWGCQSP